MEPVTLETSRLLLRPWRLADAADVLEYARDEEWSRFLHVPRPYTARDAEEFVARSLLHSWDTHPVWAIEVRSEGKAAGGINIRIERDHATAEVGYGIARWHWGQGYITEACKAVFAWTFETFGLAKIVAAADAENVASWRVMEKLGMQREAYLRSHRVLRGERRDEVRYGLLRDEFPRP
ncbi:MAG: GNAT family N-acetyltransferase [Dehalococcoidia bacterium]